MKEIFRLDPSNAMISFADMMKSQITMPAELMTDGVNDNLFADFSQAAQSIGVYTAVDYAKILGTSAARAKDSAFYADGSRSPPTHAAYLVKEFDAEHVGGLTPEAAAAQELVCSLPQRYLKLAERSMRSLEPHSEEALRSKFSWLKPRA